MQSYKICQPCRAYSRTKSSDKEDEDDNSGDGNDANSNDELQDGEGEAEQWGYNCYDDAGYTNCNQVSCDRYCGLPGPA